MRYTIYFYEVRNEWFVFDTRTNCLVGGSGTSDKAVAQLTCNELNNCPVS
jgi:hypothetical protein